MSGQVGKREGSPRAGDARDVLVAIVKDRRDLEIARTERWYRIPVRSAPKNLEAARWLAFYQTKAFGEERWAIRYYAPILGRSILKRRDLLPDQPDHPRAHQDYYKLELGELHCLERPIISRRGRRVVFIPTTWEKFCRAEEINDLFHESPLEDALYDELKRHRIESERQFFVRVGSACYCLDFAIFCRRGNIDIECDGETWHSDPKGLRRDRHRNNILASAGWAVLRFGSRELADQMALCLRLVRATIRAHGGLTRAREIPR
jgi:very-short-patch-repair endonuclease